MSDDLVGKVSLCFYSKRMSEKNLIINKLQTENQKLILRIALDEIALKEASEAHDDLEQENQLLKKKLERALNVLRLWSDNFHIGLELVEIEKMKNEVGE